MMKEPALEGSGRTRTDASREPSKDGRIDTIGITCRDLNIIKIQGKHKPHSASVAWLRRK